MQKLFHLFPFLLLLALLSCADQEEPSQPEDTTPSPTRQTNVTIQVVTPDSLIQYSRLPATVHPWHDATISALESGVVWSLQKDLGDKVKRGDVLAELKLDVLEQMAIEAEANLKFQTYNFKHSQQLMSEGSISEQAHQNTEYDYKRALSNAKTIRTRLDFGRIRAPFHGRIAQRFIDKGQLVPQGGATFRLVQIDSVRIEAWVSENEIVDFAKGRQVTLTLDSFPNEVFQGTVGKMGTAADGNRRVFPIEVHLANFDERILPGMIGKLQILRQIYRQAVVAPREAILERETGPVAFVAINNKAYLRPLELGAAENDRVVVKKGLTFNDLLIVKGNRDLIDGDPILIQKTESTQ